MNEVIEPKIRWSRISYGIKEVSVEPYRTIDCYGREFEITCFIHDGISLAFGSKIKKDGTPSKVGSHTPLDKLPANVQAEFDKLGKVN